MYGLGLRFGSYVQSASMTNQEPYDLSFGLNDVPSLGQLAAIPIKASLGANLVNAASWRALTALRGGGGFFRGDPFNPGSVLSRYRSGTFSGLTGDLISATGTGLENMYHKWIAVDGKPKIGMHGQPIGQGFRGDALETGWRKMPWYRKARYNSARDKFIKQQIKNGDYRSLTNTYGMSMMQRVIIRPQRLHDVVSRISPELGKAVTSDELGNTVLTHMYEASVKNISGQGIPEHIQKAILAQRVASVDEAVSAFGTPGSDLRDAMRVSSTPLPPELDVTLGSKVDYAASNRFNFKSRLRERRAFLKDVARRHEVSVWDMISGKGISKEEKEAYGFFQRRSRAFKDVILGSAEAQIDKRQFVMMHRGGRKARQAWQRSLYSAESGIREHIMNAARKQAADTGKVLESYETLAAPFRSAGAKTQLERWSLNASKRRIAPLGVGTTLMGTAMTLGVAAWAVKKAVTMGAEIPARVGATIRSLTRAEFGSGDVINNSSMATERQRAISAIQNAQMNARYMLGSEAAMYH